MCRITKYLAVVLAFGLVGLGTASAGQILINGGFETGDFTGWLVFDQPGGDGSFFVDPTTLTPVSSLPTVGPAGGAFYAVSDQGDPGAHVLIQLFTVAPGWLPPGWRAILAFDMFVNDSNDGPIVNPAGLDYSAVPNQHARVDLLSGTAGPFETGAGVLRNFYLSVDPGGSPHAYTHYSFDITNEVGGGGTFLIRFAEVDNQGFLNQGVDNVSIAGVPEPASAVLLGLGLLGLIGFGYRRRIL